VGNPESTVALEEEDCSELNVCCRYLVSPSKLRDALKLSRLTNNIAQCHCYQHPPVTVNLPVRCID
jgi:hypothetical protein